MLRVLHCLLLLASVNRVYAAPVVHQNGLSISVSSTSPFALTVSNGQQEIQNTAILAGNTNVSAAPISASTTGVLKNNHGQISLSIINAQVAKVSIQTDYKFVGARFQDSESSKAYGVWEYPWSDQLTNNGIKFDLKGTGDSQGVNWDNARAPFFFSSDGYGVYADTIDMGSYDFTQQDSTQFTFNTSSLVYYIILPQAPGDMKSILTAYAGLSNTIYMPPDSSYGPTFWSDDWEQDFHGGVHNSQQNYYDTVNHLYDYQIHATAMFADRPYGTGNYSWGNFDFAPRYYPTPEQFIANLSHWGYDFQVWAANRAFLNTDLFNAAKANGWLFPGINPEFFLGPALNLSIPEAYQYFKKRLSYFPSVGVKGYKIDRGEEGEMPGKSRAEVSRNCINVWQSTNRTSKQHSLINYATRPWSKNGEKVTFMTLRGTLSTDLGPRLRFGMEILIPTGPGSLTRLRVASDLVSLDSHNGAQILEDTYVSWTNLGRTSGHDGCGMSHLFEI